MTKTEREIKKHREIAKEYRKGGGTVIVGYKNLIIDGRKYNWSSADNGGIVPENNPKNELQFKTRKNTMTNNCKVNRRRTLEK